MPFVGRPPIVRFKPRANSDSLDKEYEAYNANKLEESSLLNSQTATPKSKGVIS